ncbi:MAG: hypothetical protein ABWY04_13820 [Arthrobacter sp.]
MHATHGPMARIIRAERVTSGGIAGFFAARHVEATVLVPDSPTSRRNADSTHRGGRAGIAALLAEAEEAEDLFRGTAQVVSTASPDFDDMLKDLSLGYPARDIPDPAPALRRGPGDLVVVVGPPETAIRAARALSAPAGGARVYTAGTAAAEGLAAVNGRIGALTARAEGVIDRLGIVVAFGAGRTAAAIHAQTPELVLLDADQVWAVVDAGRKTDDTQAWLAAVAAVFPIDALYIVGSEETATPETVHAHGIPVGMLDTEAD